MTTVNGTGVDDNKHAAELISASSGDVEVCVVRTLARVSGFPLFGFGPDACRRPENYNSESFAGLLKDLSAIGSGSPLVGESQAKTVRPLIKPEAKMRLITLYGMGSVAVSMGNWWNKAPSWLEVRTIELPGHGWRESELLPLSAGAKSDFALFSATAAAPPSFIESDFCTKREYEAHVAATSGDADAAAFASFDAARDVFVGELVDAMMPLLDAPYAIYGFSNGSLLGFLAALEIERRGVRPPCCLFIAGRGAPHLDHAEASFLTWFHGLDDEGTIAWAENAGVLPPAAERGPVKINARFGPVSRAGVIGMHGVGTKRGPGAASFDPPFPGCGGHHCGLAYTPDAPRLSQTPVVAMLGKNDDMWPSDRYLQKWSEATTAGFRPFVVAGVPHHHLQGHQVVMEEVFGELAEMVTTLR